MRYSKDLFGGAQMYGTTANCVIQGGCYGMPTTCLRGPWEKNSQCRLVLAVLIRLPPVTRADASAMAFLL